jgi:DNA primase
MSRIPDAFIDEVLARTDIVELIESRVPLKRAGREYHACCPFHDERTPSFTVSPTKQFYHCFGCGAHGTAVRFLMEFDRLEFPDAVEELARRAGLEVPREASRARAPEGEDLYGVLASAQQVFARQLAASEPAKRYLAGRGLDRAIIERYGIGFAPDGWEHLKSALGTDARRLALLDKVGLLSRNDQGRVYDKFRNRIMFPIRDRRGRTIAFGGRVIDKDDSPKYLNSPETPLFHKGRELYGLHEARQASSKLKRLVVVEGYMDVVSLAQFGFTDAVATLGTATTRDHAELLFRNAPDVVFCFDGDRAGRAAAWRAVENVLPRMRDGRQALFLFLPEGEDPDTIVRKEGPAGFAARLAQTMPLSEFLFAELSADVDLKSLEGRARLAERARPLIAQVPDGAFRDLLGTRLTELTGIRPGAAPTAAPAAWTPATKRPTAGNPAPRRSLVRTAIAMLIQQPRLVEAMEPPYLFAALRQPGVPLLMELIELIRERPQIQSGALLEHFEGREERNALDKLVMQDLGIAPERWSVEFTDCLRQLDRQTRQQRLDEINARAAESGFAGLSDAEKTEWRELQQALRGVARSS